MRVTHIITRLIVGGAQENTVASVFGLRDRHEVDTTLISGLTTGPEGSLESQFDDFPELLTVVPELVRPVDPVNDWKALRQLTRLLREQQPDIVHTHSGKAGALGRLAARWAGVPVIIHTIHGPSFGPFQGRLANFVFRAAERFAARRTDHFVTVANAMRDQYLAAGIGRPDQYTRIFSGFPLEPYLKSAHDAEMRQRVGVKKSDFVVGKIARLFDLKGHDDLFAIAPALVNACPNIRFLLVGDGPRRDEFEAQVEKLDLEDHFIFTGLVAPHEVPRYVGVMDVLVHLSLREGLPRALPQAMAAGRTVVAYDCDGAREVCLEDVTGFLLKPGDREGLKERLLRLAGNPTLRERLGHRGQELVTEWFPVERMVDDLYELYQKLLDAHEGRTLKPNG